MRIATVLVVLAACGKPPAAAGPGVAAASVASARPHEPHGPLPRHRAILLPDPGALDVLAVSPDGARLVAGGDAAPAVLVEVARGRVLARLEERARLRGAAFARGGDRVLVSSGDGLALYDGAGKRLAARKGSFGRVAACEDGFVVADASLPGPRLVDAALADRASARIDGILGYRGPIACDGALVAVATKDAVALFTLPGLKPRGRLSAADDHDVLRDVALHQGQVAALSNAGSVWLFSAERGVRLAFEPYAGGSSLAFAPREGLLAAGAALFEVPTLRVRHRFRTGATFRAVRFAPDGALVAGHGGLVGVYDVAAALAAGEPDGLLGAPRALVFDPRGELLAVGEEGRVVVFRPGRVLAEEGMGPVVAAWETGAGEPTRVAFDAEGQKLVTAGGGAVRVFDVAGRPLARWLLGDPGVEVALAVAAGRIAVGVSGRVLVHDEAGRAIASVGPFQTPSGEPVAPAAVALAPSGKEVAVAWAGRTAVYELPTGRLVRELGPAGDPAGVALAFGAGSLVRAAGTATVWRTPFRTGRGRALELPPASAVGLSPRADALGWASGSQSIVGVSELGERPRSRWQAAVPGQPLAVAWDDRRGLLWSTGDDLAVRAWDLAAGKARAVWLGAAGPRIERLAFPSARELLVVSADGRARLWSLASGAPLTFEEIDVDDPDDVRLIGDRLVVARGVEVRSFTRAGREADLQQVEGEWVSATILDDGQAANVAPDGALVLIDPASGGTRRERAAAAPGAPIEQAVVSRDGRRLLLSRDDKLELWDLERRRRLGTAAARGPFRQARFGGGRVFFALDDGGARVWEGDGAPEKLCRGAEGRLLDVSADGNRAALLGEALVVWDLDACRRLGAVLLEGQVVAAAFAPGGARLAVATRDGTVHLATLPGLLPEAILRHLGQGAWSAWWGDGRYLPPRHGKRP